MRKIKIDNLGEMYVHDHETEAEKELANYELGTVDYLLKHAREDSNFMDIGGYEGYFTIVLGKKIKSGKIFTFEPCSGSYEIIKKNVELHGLNNVTLYHNAVSNKTSFEVPLYWRYGAQCISRIFEFPPGIDNNAQLLERVSSICLDDFDKNVKIDLIKIDIEGAEVELFQGAKEFFKRNRDCIVVLELHCNNIRNRGIDIDNFVKEFENMFNFRDNKYDIEVIRNCLNTSHGQTIFAISPKHSFSIIDKKCLYTS